MMQPICVAFLTLAVLAATHLSAAPVAAETEWELTFEETFDGPTLDPTIWKMTDYWGNQTLPNSKSLQCYQSSQVSVDNGRLLLTAREQPVAKQDCRAAKQDLEYTSGLISTSRCNRYEKAASCRALKGFSQAFGYFEARGKFPSGKGLWPAFWLVPADASWPPEIDVFESIGEPGRLYHTYHFSGDGRKRQDDKRVDLGGEDFHDSFHSFAVDWQPGRIVWFVDGVEVHRVEGPHVSAKPMYMILNMAVGGRWPGRPDSRTQFPAVFEVDHVRVYRRTDPNAAAPPSATTPD